VVEHLLVPPAPAAAGVLEVTDQLLLLDVHADHRQPLGQVQLAHGCQVAELPISVRVPNARSLLATGLQGEALLFEHPGDRFWSQPDATAAQGLLELAERAVSPLQAGDRIASDGVF